MSRAVSSGALAILGSALAIDAGLALDSVATNAAAAAVVRVVEHVRLAAGGSIVVAIEPVFVTVILAGSVLAQRVGMVRCRSTYDATATAVVGIAADIEANAAAGTNALNFTTVDYPALFTGCTGHPARAAVIWVDVGMRFAAVAVGVIRVRREVPIAICISAPAERDIA